MNVLKSLSDFKKESGVLESAQLKQVTGGYIKDWYEATCIKDRSDVSHMKAEFRFNGKEYVQYGIAYETQFRWGDIGDGGSF